MANIRIKAKGLDELVRRFDRWPQVWRREENILMDAMLHTIWDHVPSYPSPPQGSTYRRTGTLGRTLGVSESGAQLGTPDIFTISQLGRTSRAAFGTNLEYAPYVIGDIASEQASVHRGRWWTLAQTVFNLVKQPLQRLADDFMRDMADFLERGL